jgi:tetratricopeptide (TPR) repeat protein
MNNKFTTLFLVFLGLLFLRFNNSAFGQNDTWQTAIQGGDRSMAQKQYADAERAYREAAKLSEKFKDRDPRKAITFIRLAEACNLQAKREEAEVFANRSLASLEKAMKQSKPEDPSEEHFRTETSATILEKAAGIFMANGKYPEAERFCKRLIETREDAGRINTFPKGNEDYLKLLAQMTTNAQAKVADAYDKLAELYFVQHRFEDAETLYAKSLKVREIAYGEGEPPAALSLSNLATLYAAQDKFEKAEPLYAQAVRIFQQTNWTDRPEVASTLENYSLLLRKTGREVEAAAMLEKARAIRAKLQQRNH